MVWEKECIYMYDWVTTLYSRNWHNTVNQIYSNKKSLPKPPKKCYNFLLLFGLLIYLFVEIFIEVWMIYNVVLISAVKQSDTIIHICFFISFSIMIYDRILNIVPWFVFFLFFFLMKVAMFISGSLFFPLFWSHLQHVEVLKSGTEHDSDTTGALTRWKLPLICFFLIHKNQWSIFVLCPIYVLFFPSLFCHKFSIFFHIKKIAIKYT